MGEIEAAAANLITSLATSKGVEIDAVAAVTLAKEWLGKGVELLDGHAKRHAAAAGAEAAAGITTEDEAELAQRKR